MLCLWSLLTTASNAQNTLQHFHVGPSAHACGRPRPQNAVIYILAIQSINIPLKPLCRAHMVTRSCPHTHTHTSDKTNEKLSCHKETVRLLRGSVVAKI